MKRQKLFILIPGALFFTMLISLNTKSIPVTNEPALITKSIVLTDQETYTLNIAKNDLLGGTDCCVHEDTNVLGYSASMLPETPLIIKSFESNITPFKILKDMAFDNLSNPRSFEHENSFGFFGSTNKFLIYRKHETNLRDFPNYRINYNGGIISNTKTDKIINAWSYGSDYLKPFFHRLMQSKAARKEIYQYIFDSYDKFSIHYPTETKKQMLERLKDVQTFVSSYKESRSHYLKLLEKGELEKIGGYNQFVYRRIENDNVPVPEILDFIANLKSIITSDITSSQGRKFIKININNNELVIEDDLESWIVSSKNSASTFYISSFLSVKYLEYNSSKYYLITTEEDEILIDKNLKIISRE